ncbi:MAG: hypothetical protein LBS59_05935 [Puniceicoccales bacterium]|jgi:hypothetical protein|nr:hypothetical protein [Puniceicoccales bacterium]
MTSVYIVLGAPDSGRLDLLADLIGNLPETQSPVRVYLTDEYSEAKANALAVDAAAEIRRWGRTPDGPPDRLFIESPETAPETVFIVTAGRINPVDQMETLAALLPALNWQVARVFTFIHCALLASHPELDEWFKACLHFSDVALLTRYETVTNAWIKNFTDAHKKECNPCLIELVRKDRPENLARILVPEARRFSKIFDDTDPLDDMVFDEENLPDEPFDIEGKPDPYFERLPNGFRRISLPDICNFLP